MAVTMMRGITLIELVIVMAIIGTLASIAYPTYREYVRETRRGDAQRAMSELAIKLEQFRLGNKTYTTNLGVGGLNYVAQTEDGHYELSVAVPEPANCPLATCFVLQAKPIGGQAGDECQALTYSSTGIKTPSGCWP